MRAFLKLLWAARRVIALYAVLLAGGWLLGEAVGDLAIPEMRPMNEPLIHRMVMTALLVFVVTAAIPFVPGAEIGFALLFLFGGKASLLVYIGMVGALVLAYWIARTVPYPVIANALAGLGLKRASALISELGPADPAARVRMLSQKIPHQFGQGVLRNRYLVLALAINMPGNTLVGGGGGLAFMAGTSGLFAFWPFLAAVMLAVAPVPLLFWLF